jgi:hypothetical protein
MAASWSSFVALHGRCYTLIGNIHRDRQRGEDLGHALEQYDDTFTQLQNATVDFRKVVEDFVF